MVASTSLSEYNPADLSLTEDLFVIPDGDQYILYAPLAKGVMMVNGAAISILQNHQAGSRSLFANSSFCEKLMTAGILVDKKKIEALSSRFKKMQAVFDPDGVSLLLTDRCTMRCVYCYSEGGKLKRTMRWETAKAALDWIVDHVLNQGRDRFFVSFHGGGEVTTAISLMKQCAEYARRAARTNKLEVRFEAGLNGVMTRTVREWVVENLNGATISLDGLPAIQDRQRPLANGKGSFEKVEASLNYLNEKGFSYGIRSTVTSESLGHLVDSVAFMAKHFSAKMIQVEPVFPIGRALQHCLAPVDPAMFVEQFRMAHAEAKKHHKELIYSGARLTTLTNIFCKAAGSSFVVTPDNEVASCYEITDPSDKRTELFYYGRWAADVGHFIFNWEKLEKLQSLAVENKPFCQNCFCKWHCAGDCPAKLAALGNAWDPSSNPRCHVNRELTKDQLKESLLS